MMYKAISTVKYIAKSSKGNRELWKKIKKGKLQILEMTTMNLFSHAINKIAKKKKK